MESVMDRRLCSIACLLILAILAPSCTGNPPADESQVDEPVQSSPSEIEAAINASAVEASEAGGATGERSLEERIRITSALGRLDDPLWSVRRDAIQTLVELDARDEAEAIRRMLADADSAVRRAAVEALEELRANQFGNDVANLLDDESARVRAAALGALRAFHARHQLERVRGLETDPDSTVRGRASRLVGKWEGYDERVGAWLLQLKDVDPDVRGAALSAITVGNYVELESNVADLLSDPAPQIRMSAVDFFGDFGGHREDFVDEIALLLADSDPRVRMNAVAVLGRRGPFRAEGQTKRVTALLALLLNDPDKTVQGYALNALGELGATEHASQIASLLGDPYVHAHQSASEILAKLRSPVDTASLFETLEPFVVRIEVESDSAIASEIQVSAGTTLGSGLFVSEDGSVLTNRHVIVGNSGGPGRSMAADWLVPKNVTVITSDGERLRTMDEIWLHPELDLAVVRPVLEPGRTIPYAPVEPYLPIVGDDVIAIGHPLGRNWSLTEGKVSQVREEEFVAELDPHGRQLVAMWIQTDAAINRGNSGGHLFDLYGRLLGVVTKKEVANDAEGLGFALSVRTLYNWHWAQEDEHLVWRVKR